jgi:hypothetical protein
MEKRSALARTLLSLSTVTLLVVRIDAQVQMISDSQLVDTVRKSRYSDNQIYEENEHNRHGSFAQFC